jgi:hypothetical protein
MENLPIANLYASQHNVVAYDYVESARRLARTWLPELDRENLVQRAREDLELIGWDSAEERDEQYAILEAEEARLGMTYVEPEERPVEAPAPNPWTAHRAIHTLLRRVPPAERAARWALRRPIQPPPEPPPPPPSYASPVDAAFAADELYTSVVGRGAP